jgi:hypothetical protein
MATVNLGSIKFKWKGTYSGATAYTIDDVVEYNGSSYICILASTGNLPTNATYFEQMSSAGTNGTNGTDLTTTLTTQGDLVYRDGSGLVRLGAGTAGQVLTTGGAGANPSWAGISANAGTYPFSAYRTGTQSAPNNTWTKVGCQTEVYDPSNVYDATTNQRYVCPADGFYFFSSAVTMDLFTGSGDIMYSSFYKNGTTAHNGAEMIASGWSASNNYITIRNTQIIQLITNDYLEFYAWNNAGGRLIQATYTNWCGFRLS